jgi:hyperosmotically inducible periplasmic protein
MKHKWKSMLLTFAIVGCDTANNNDMGNNSRNPTGAKAANRDNTAVNARDRDQSTLTPLDQGQNKEDIAITADIRRRVLEGKMSTNAENVKIITQNGNVTLRGPVSNADEKSKIENIARSVAGDAKVDNLLDITQK